MRLSYPKLTFSNTDRAVLSGQPCLCYWFESGLVPAVVAATIVSAVGFERDDLALGNVGWGVAIKNDNHDR